MPPEKNHMKHWNPPLHHHNEIEALDSLTPSLKKFLKHPDIIEEEKTTVDNTHSVARYITIDFKKRIQRLKYKILAEGSVIWVNLLNRLKLREVVEDTPWDQNHSISQMLF